MDTDLLQAIGAAYKAWAEYGQDNGHVSDHETRNVVFPNSTKVYTVKLTYTQWAECDSHGIGTKGYYGHIASTLAAHRRATRVSTHGQIHMF